MPEAAGERVFAELRRLVISDGVIGGLELADRLGVLASVLPELSALHGVEQSHYHHLDVYDHTLEVLTQMIGWSATCHPRFAQCWTALADELTRGQALRLERCARTSATATREVLRRASDFMRHDSIARNGRTVSARLRTSARLSRSWRRDPPHRCGGMVTSAR